MTRKLGYTEVDLRTETQAQRVFCSLSNPKPGITTAPLEVVIAPSSRNENRDSHAVSF